MPCIFTDDTVKLNVDGRKIYQSKRASKNDPSKSSVSYYLPLYKNEIEFLGLTENSLIRAELSRVEKNDSIKRPAFEIQAEFDQLRTRLKKILDEYDDDTSIRKSILVPKIQKILGEQHPPTQN